MIFRDEQKHRETFPNPQYHSRPQQQKDMRARENTANDDICIVWWDACSNISHLSQHYVY